jgi:hypothetical protein
MSAVDHLVQLAGIRIFVRAHHRVTPTGNTVRVGSYYRNITSVADLDPQELKAAGGKDAVEKLLKKSKAPAFKDPARSKDLMQDIAGRKALPGGTAPPSRASGKKALDKILGSPSMKKSLKANPQAAVDDGYLRRADGSIYGQRGGKGWYAGDVGPFTSEQAAKDYAAGKWMRSGSDRKLGGKVEYREEKGTEPKNWNPATGRARPGREKALKSEIKARLDAVDAEAAARPGTEKARVQIRPRTYGTGPGNLKEVEGFVISGTDTRGRRVKIAVPTREEAERVVARIKAGEERTLDVEFERDRSRGR